MRLQTVALLCLGALARSVCQQWFRGARINAEIAPSTAVAWTNQDHEIFDLVSALEAAEGPKTNFYSFMNVSPTATTAEIAKTYRKRSLELHPDRGGDPERFARLGVISGILRDAERRKHYHHFYENGVPRWRGTGYYYSRYRPGLGSVLVFLSLLSVLIQYAVQHFVRFAEVQRIKRIKDRAQETAWGPSKHAPSATSAKKRVKVALGDNQSNTVNMTVEADGSVCLIDESGKSHPVDDTAACKPSIGSTWLPVVGRNLWRKIQKKPASLDAIPASNDLGAVDSIPPPVDTHDDSDAPDTPRSGAATPVDGDATNRRARRQQAKESKKKR